MTAIRFLYIVFLGCIFPCFVPQNKVNFVKKRQRRDSG